MSFALEGSVLAKFMVLMGLAGIAIIYYVNGLKPDPHSPFRWQSGGFQFITRELAMNTKPSNLMDFIILIVLIFSGALTYILQGPL